MNKIDELKFLSNEDKHELSSLYEDKIKNMGNAGRNGGEYYTPRPLIKSIVKVETVYDGAVGSAGPVCVTLVDLMKALEDSHKNPDAFKALRRKVLDTIFYKLDGHSAKRASEAILSHYEDFKKGKAAAS